MHNVASAKSLRVLEGRSVEDFAGLQVRQIHHDGRGSAIDGESVYFALIRIDSVPIDIHAVPHSFDNGVEGHVAVDGVG